MIWATAARASKGNRNTAKCIAAIVAVAVFSMLASCENFDVDPVHGAGGVHSYYSTCVVESIDEDASEIVLTFQSGKPDWVEEDAVVFGTSRLGHSVEELGISEGDLVDIEYMRAPREERIEIESMVLR